MLCPYPAIVLTGLELNIEQINDLFICVGFFGDRFNELCFTLFLELPLKKIFISQA